MATFLTTSRMAPELRARIEASVAGSREKRGRSPRLVALARFAIVLVLAGITWVAVSTKRSERADLEAARAAALAAVAPHAASLTPDDRGALVVIDSWLARSAGPYAGDVKSDELRAEGGLAKVMARPTVYVRGAVGAFVNPARINDAATDSAKDALLLCLTAPPATKDEKVLLTPVRTAMLNPVALEQQTPNARRLNDARVGLPFLTPEWAARVRAADTQIDLLKAKRDLDKVRLDRTLAALRAQVLVYAMDEPSDGGGPTELDGERGHQVRLGIVDLAASKVLLRVRRPVDPTFISPARKAEYAVGLDSCALVVDTIAELHK